MSDPAKLLVDHLDIWTGAIERKSGSGRGNGGKISLYGIDKLRSLILDLAVRGKLVPQDPSDGDAHVVADRLIRLAASQEKSRKTNASNGANWELAALNYEVPSSWASISLSNLVRVVNGRAYKKTEFKNEGTPILRVGNLFTSDNWFYSDLELDDDKYCESGDLIYAWSASFGPFIWSGPKVIYHYHIWKLPFISEHSVDKEFLYTVLLQKTAEIKAAGHGIAMAHMTKEKMEYLAIPLPPLAEQKRIVAKVDELMALVDALEAGTRAGMAAHETLVRELLAALVNSQDLGDLARNWSRIETHFDTLFTTEESIESLKQTVLELAVRGKLETETSNESSVAEDGFPVGWKVEELSRLAGEFDSGWSPACPDRPVEDLEDWGVLKTTAIQDLEYHEWENKTLPENLEPRPKAEVKAGDVVITRAGPYNRVGVVCFVRDTRPRLMLSDKLIRFRPNEDKIDGEYLALALRTGISRDYLVEAQSGMAKSQVNISQAKLAKTPVPFPTVEKQRKIVNKVAQVTALIAELRDKQLKTEPLLVRIADSVVRDVGSA